MPPILHSGSSSFRCRGAAQLRPPVAQPPLAVLFPDSPACPDLVVVTSHQSRLRPFNFNLSTFNSLLTRSTCPTAQWGFCYSENDMASHLNRAYYGLRALSLSVALFFGGVAVHAQEAAVVPPSADSKPATDADFIAAAEEVLGQMSQITGLKLVTPLKKSLRSREEIGAYVVKQMNEDKNPAERYAGQRSAEALGLLPNGFDL